MRPIVFGLFGPRGRSDLGAFWPPSSPSPYLSLDTFSQAKVLSVPGKRELDSFWDAQSDVELDSFWDAQSDVELDIFWDAQSNLELDTSWDALSNADLKIEDEAFWKVVTDVNGNVDDQETDKVVTIQPATSNIRIEARSKSDNIRTSTPNFTNGQWRPDKFNHWYGTSNSESIKDADTKRIETILKSYAISGTNEPHERQSAVLNDVEESLSKLSDKQEHKKNGKFVTKMGKRGKCLSAHVMCVLILFGQVVLSHRIWRDNQH